MRFAHMKRILKLDRLRLRGLSGAKDEVLLTATAQNLRRLAKLLCHRRPTVAACLVQAREGYQGHPPQRRSRGLQHNLPRSGRKAEMGRALQHSLISNLFSLFRLYKFPVRTLAAIRQKCPRVRDIVTKITAAQVPFSRISLYFSLLAGILGRRPGRDGLGRQPASAVSVGYFLLLRKLSHTSALRLAFIGLLG